MQNRGKGDASDDTGPAHGLPYSERMFWFRVQPRYAPTPPGMNPGEGLFGISKDIGAPSEPGTRLNLLLSCPGWRPDPWVERFPRLLEPMGIASHTARCGREASALIKAIPIHLAVVDLAIPLDQQGDGVDDAGIRLLEVLSRLETTPPTVVIKRGMGERDDHREMTAALRAGAFAVIDRPREARDLEVMLDVLRRALVRFYQGRWPGASPVPPNFV